YTCSAAPEITTSLCDTSKNVTLLHSCVDSGSRHPGIVPAVPPGCVPSASAGETTPRPGTPAETWRCHDRSHPFPSRNAPQGQIGALEPEPAGAQGAHRANAERAADRLRQPQRADQGGVAQQGEHL